MVDKYADIADKQWDDIPEPALLPEGTYLLKGQNVSYFPANPEEEKSARVVFFYEVKEPMDDVDQEELSKLGDNYDFANNDVTKQFFINRDKDWAQVRKHLELHGIDTKGKSQPDTFKEFKGTEVLGSLVQNTFVNKLGVEQTNNQVALFAKV